MAKDFSSKNIIVGAATFYVGPVDKELSKINVSSSIDTLQDPAKVSNADSASWYHLGYTQNGVTMNIEPTYGEVIVDQLLDVAKMFKTSQRVTLSTDLTEATLENLYVAIGSRAGDVTFINATASADFPLVLADAIVKNKTASYDAPLPAGSATLLVNSQTAGATGSAASAQIVTALELNAGALGYTPIERSVCFVGTGPKKLDTAGNKNVERIYIGYRAVSMDPVSMVVQRDNATTYRVNLRLMPSDTYQSHDGNATYGKILDRVYG